MTFLTTSDVFPWFLAGDGVVIVPLGIDSELDLDFAAYDQSGQQHSKNYDMNAIASRSTEDQSFNRLLFHLMPLVSLPSNLKCLVRV